MASSNQLDEIPGRENVFKLSKTSDLLPFYFLSSLGCCFNLDQAKIFSMFVLQIPFPIPPICVTERDNIMKGHCVLDACVFQLVSSVN